MKKMKMTIAAAIFCAAAFAGYTAYDKATMTDQEKLLQANIEALTRSESDYPKNEDSVWNVKKRGSAGTSGVDVDVECETGGTYKCPLPL